MAVTISDVESLSSTAWSQLSDTKKQDLLDIATREANGLYSKRVRAFPTLDGDEDDFITYLAAHKWEQAEGGEANSQSSTGGSVSYNTVTGNPMKELQETRYGRTAYQYLRDEQSIGVELTY